MLSKIKLECNLEVILSILAVSYFILIAIHYLSYQSDIDKATLREQELNLTLDQLQEKNNNNGESHDSGQYIQNSQDIIQANNNFMALLNDVAFKSLEYPNYSYNRILKKNNNVFINLQFIKSKNKNNSIKSLKGIKNIYKNFDFSINKLKSYENFIRIYLFIKLK